MTPKDTPPGAMAMTEERLEEICDAVDELRAHFEDRADRLDTEVPSFAMRAEWTLEHALSAIATLRAQVREAEEEREELGFMGDGYRLALLEINTLPITGQTIKDIINRALTPQPAPTEGSKT